MDWIWPSEFDVLIILKGQVNVFKGRWHFYSLVYAETHAHRFVIVDVGILTKDHDFNVAEF